MKVLLYFENEKMLKKSGIGRALEHQKKALSLNGIEYTLNKKDTYDVAHVNTYFSKGTMLMKKLKKKGIPSIAHGHSTIEDYKNSFWFWKITQGYIHHRLKKTYSAPERIITPTPYSKKLIENYSFVSCPVVAISNGIDFKKYHDVSFSQEEMVEQKAKFGIRPTDKVVMGIGWFFERKGTHDFIEIAKSFDDTTKFIWFGSTNKALMTSKIAKAVKNKPDNVILPGYVPQETIIKMLHCADCFLFPSYEETEGIVLLEALACECPVIIRDIGAFDYLENEKDCLKANDNQGFISMIHKALNEDMTEIISNGLKVASDRDLKIIGEKLKEQYEIVIEQKK